MQYTVTVKADKGRFKIRTFASDADTAKKIVMAAECCPERAIVSVRARSKDLYDKLVSKVNCRYGAPMGRNSNVPSFFDWDSVQYFDRAVPLDDGGYDRGGAYWGLGAPMRVRYSKDGEFFTFYREWEHTTLLLPEWCIPAIVNDDFSGCDETEIKKVRDFIKENKVMHINPTGEPLFSGRNDLDNMGGTVYRCNVTYKTL